MATYQFIVQLIPSLWLKNKENTVELFYDDEFYDPSIAWKDYPANYNSIVQELNGIFTQKTSWQEEILIWGDEESNDIQVSIHDHSIEAIKFRLDLRKDIGTLKLRLIDLAKKLDCVFFFPELKLIELPEIGALNRAISNSTAFRFVENPRKFIEKLKSHNGKKLQN